MGLKRYFWASNSASSRCMALTTSSYIILAFWRLGHLCLVDRRGLGAYLFLRCFDGLGHFGFGWVGSELLC